MTGAAIKTDTAAGVLAGMRSARHREVITQAEQLALAVQWAAMHSVDSIDDGATCFGNTPVPIAGPGAPLVAEFSIAEIAASMGLPTETGKAFVGEAIELAHRLPRLYAQVRELRLPAWKARRIARDTMCLSAEAAGFVDRHLAPVAHKVGPSVVDRLIAEAEARFMPTQAAEKALAAMDARHVTIDHQQVSMTGTSRVHGELDLPDALDLEAAVAVGAEHRKRLGCTGSLDVRRAAALGDLARRQLTLDLSAEVPARRPVVLSVHISDRALTDDEVVGRVENTGTPITIEQIQAWIADPYADVVVKPILNLTDHIHVTRYEIPDRLRTQVDETDQTCVFPWCTRRAKRCDHDHVIAYDQSGSTCGCNIAPLCRAHHRLKTHHGSWSYSKLDHATYLWRSPHGYHYLRDHNGTADVSRQREGPPVTPSGS